MTPENQPPGFPGWFKLSLTYGYLDATYDDYVFDAATDFSGTRMVRAPEHTFNVGVQYTLPLATDSRLILRGDYAYLTEFFHAPGEAMPQFGSAVSLTREPAYGIADFRVIYEHANWRLTGYVNNAFDEEYRRTVNTLGSGGAGALIAFAGQPRTYGARLSYSY